MSPDDDPSDDSDPTEARDAPLDEDDWVEFDDDSNGPIDTDTGGETDDSGEPDDTTAESGTVETAPAGEKYCQSCGTTLDADAKFCSACGTEQADATAAGSTAESPKDRVTAGVLGILLGGLGAHHFYLGNVGIGVLYLCFFWTGIPAVVGLIEGILYLSKTDQEFQRAYVDDEDDESDEDGAESVHESTAASATADDAESTRIVDGPDDTDDGHSE
ncbi:zinc-ribbon domain and TM2 domain-containing protein [Haloarcula sp. GH36]|uniref:zinc-ribbon domain and TM2 domain-containing protein n=1 Tax=Haloarcula montana TaxID=3111776 RepID=UPI002D789989|nr:TM2 domain-containing protein [Haloarcula sp. GH36]